MKEEAWSKTRDSNDILRVDFIKPNSYISPKSLLSDYAYFYGLEDLRSYSLYNYHILHFLFCLWTNLERLAAHFGQRFGCSKVYMIMLFTKLAAGFSQQSQPQINDQLSVCYVDLLDCADSDVPGGDLQASLQPGAVQPRRGAPESLWGLLHLAAAQGQRGGRPGLERVHRLQPRGECTPLQPGVLCG